MKRSVETSFSCVDQKSFNKLLDSPLTRLTLVLLARFYDWETDLSDHLGKKVGIFWRELLNFHDDKFRAAGVIFDNVESYTVLGVDVTLVKPHIKLWLTMIKNPMLARDLFFTETKTRNEYSSFCHSEELTSVPDFLMDRPSCAFLLFKSSSIYSMWKMDSITEIKGNCYIKYLALSEQWNNRNINYTYSKLCSAKTNTLGYFGLAIVFNYLFSEYSNHDLIKMKIGWDMTLACLSLVNSTFREAFSVHAKRFVFFGQPEFINFSSVYLSGWDYNDDIEVWESSAYIMPSNTLFISGTTHYEYLVKKIRAHIKNHFTLGNLRLTSITARADGVYSGGLLSLHRFTIKYDEDCFSQADKNLLELLATSIPDYVKTVGALLRIANSIFDEEYDSNDEDTIDFEARDFIEDRNFNTTTKFILRNIKINN